MHEDRPACYVQQEFLYKKFMNNKVQFLMTQLEKMNIGVEE